MQVKQCSSCRLLPCISLGAALVGHSGLKSIIKIRKFKTLIDYKVTSLLYFKLLDMITKRGNLHTRAARVALSGWLSRDSL